MSSPSSLSPIPLNTPMLTSGGILTNPWRGWFQALFNRAGGNTALTNTQLAQLNSSPVSVVAVAETGSDALSSGSQIVEVNSASASPITLPSAAGNKQTVASISYSLPIIIINVGTGVVTVVPSGADTFPGGSVSQSIPAQGQAIDFYPNNAGNGWLTT